MFEKYAPVSLFLFRDVLWFNATPQLKSFLDSRDALLARFQALVEHKQNQGEITSQSAVSDVSIVLITLFLFNVRQRLLTQSKRPDQGFAAAERQFEIVLRGLSPP